MLALRLLDEAAGALARLDDGDDPEALHDFRVAVRRLRSSLRAYSGALEHDVVDTALERLRALGARSGRARDLEVQVAWLTERASALRPSHRRDLRWLAARLEDRKLRAYEGIADGLAAAFARASGELREMLGAYRAVVRLDGDTPDETLSQTAAQLLREHGELLRQRLGEIRDCDADVEAHRARIEAKRLRYLLEPLARSLESGRSLVKRLKRLQNLLGELHDLHLLDVTLETTLERVSLEHVHAQMEALRVGGDEGRRLARRRNRAPGLLAIARLARERRAKLYAELEVSWLGESPTDFFEGVAAAVAELATPAARRAGSWRRYLLDAVPELAREAPFLEIEQGWLPGEKIRERLSRTVDGARERYHRTIETSRGAEHGAVEEEIDAEAFHRLWPFTEGFRVARRCHRLADGGLVWQIDEFRDRDLVLAVVALPSPDAAAEPPVWLRRHVVREVTHEDEYASLSLAR